MLYSIELAVHAVVVIFGDIPFRSYAPMFPFPILAYVIRFTIFRDYFLML